MLFHELAGLPAAERERRLADPRVEPRVREEVESLLRYDLPENQELTACIAGVAAEVLDPVQAEPVQRCGPYRLVRLLGSGGMGDVYLAEREGEIRQQVAVKLLAFRRARWRERFLRERQLLASLQHPSIVHAIDAGHTSDGRPFLVMEYVAGESIDVYASRIGICDRLGLYLRVCEAVSHAHRRLIIHRDLKPSNILVDESGQPKLLDFGIAKLLDETGDLTQTSERAFTPSYASPEQLRGDLQTTATDIYSLGAVLYKLLTDRLPNEHRTRTPPSRLNPNVPSDLDYVLQKALRQAPEERYASVEALAADIRAVLESRPVAARAGDVWYRTRKFLRRYSAPLAALALIVVSLAAGLFVANRERLKAERRFAQLRELSNNVFALDRAIRDLPGSTEARQRLVAVSLKYLKGLAADAHGDVDLTREIGEGYLRIGRIQGVPTELNLGERAEAEASLKTAGELLDTVLASRPTDRRALLDSARVAHDRMILAEEEHRYADAQAQAQKAAKQMDAFLRRGEATDAERSEAAQIFGNIALACINMHLYTEAEPFAHHTVEISRTLRSPDLRLSLGLSLLANSYRYQGKLQQALRTIRVARQAAQATHYSNETERMFGMYGVLLREGTILGEDGGVNLNRPTEAAAALRQAFELADQLARRDPQDAVSRDRVANSGNQLGNILRHSDPQAALAVYDLSIRRLSEIRDSLTARRDRALLLADSSYALRSLHRDSEAKRRAKAALAILESTKDYPAKEIRFESAVYATLCALADEQAAAGNPRQAIQIYESVLGKVHTAKQEAFSDLRNAPRLSQLYETLARLYARTGDLERAGDMQSLRIQLWRSWDRKLPNNSFIRREMLSPLSEPRAKRAVFH